MNCQDFESNIDNMARGALMDARAREVARAHESVCARCAARLANERAITSGLRALAADTKHSEAPARVEAALLAAFRARTASTRIAVAGTLRAHETARNDVASAPDGNVLPLGGETLTRPWSWMKTVASASLAAAAALALFMLIPPTVPKTKDAPVASQTVARKTDRNPKGAVETATLEGGQTNAPIRDAATTSGLPVAVGSVSRVNPPRNQSVRPVQAMNASFNKGNARASQTQRGFAQTNNNEEVMTDFIPLMQGDRLAQGDAGHLVRVELPRSALERFGLPLNAERADGRVKADVLLGEDGLARAIRFVR